MRRHLQQGGENGVQWAKHCMVGIRIVMGRQTGGTFSALEDLYAEIESLLGYVHPLPLVSAFPTQVPHCLPATTFGLEQSIWI
jgi:hypothetical protein